MITVEVLSMTGTTRTIGGDDLEVTILMPCLNEGNAISTCIREARRALDAAEIEGEVLVVDNGSVDGSAELAREAGARVVREPQKGYGNAYLRGFKEARGRYIVIGDSDGTYDFSLVPQFLGLLRNGCDFVNGSRIKGDMSPGAMPFLHRYVGVPVLSWLLNRFSGAKFSDAHCGMRGFTREAVETMELRTSGMELASEMILQAARANLRMAELPIPYRARTGSSKLHTFSDGWRHLRFMLLYSPTHLFAIPGVASLAAGLIMLLTLVWGRVEIGQISFDIHYMVVGSLLTLLGFQVLALGVYGRMYAYSIGILRDDPLLFWAKHHLTLERGLVVGFGASAMGTGLLVWILSTWVFGGLSFQSTGSLLRPALLGLTLVLIGTQTIFGAFFTSLLAMKFDKFDEQQETVLVQEMLGASR
jgi:glycosyltransferase involved in cell wall biosynthesis